MLLCKSCNTRFEEGKSACPSCGRRVFASVKDDRKSAEPEPASLSATSSSDADAPTTAVDHEQGGRLGSRPTRSEPQASEGGPLHEQGGRLKSRPTRNKPQASAGATLHELGEVDVLAEAVEPEAAKELEPEPRARPRLRGRSLDIEPGPAVFHLSAAQVRTLVAEQPALLDPSLTIYRDAKNGAVGVDFRTPVGSIDLLARDGGGGFVVVSVPDPRDVDTLMPEILARIGYVRKHLASDHKPVRGIVVIEEIPEELAYAAAGVAQTVSFYAFRVALTFHPLPS
jgi:predicted  nucleic acid-binding Zn-ribbon protein